MEVNEETYNKLLNLGIEIEQLTHAEFEESETKCELREVTKKILLLCAQMNPDDLRVLEWLGYVYLHSRDPESTQKAEDFFKKGYELADDDLQVKFAISLGNTYRRQREYGKAIDFYKKASDQIDHPVIWSNIALTYDKWGKRSKAEEYAEKGLEVYNKNPEKFGETLKEEIEEVRDGGLDWDSMLKKEDEFEFSAERKKVKYKSSPEKYLDLIKKELEAISD